MVVNSIALFKTPLDPDYKNVFDGYATANDYYNTLTSFYTYITIDDLNKSVKTNGLNATITIPKSAYSLTDYNYCSIWTSGVDRTFYFITNVESLNDNGTNPSALLTLKYDSFANNFSVLKNSFYNDNNFIEQRHYTFSKVATAGLVTNGDVTDEPKPEKMVNSPYSLITQTDDKQIVLWYKLRISNETYVYNINPSSAAKIETLGINGLSETNSTTPICYIPCCALKIEGNSVKIDRNVTTIGYRTVLNSDGSLKKIRFQGTTILSVELTTYSPIYYYFQNDVCYLPNVRAKLYKGEDGGVGNALPMFFNTPSSIYYERCIAVEDDIAVHDYDNLARVICIKSASTLYNANTSYNVTHIFPTTYIGTNKLKDTTIYEQCEERVHLYPYTYGVLRINGEDRPLVPHKDSNIFKVDIDLKLGSKPTYKLYEDGFEKLKNWKPIENNGNIVTTVDSKEYYLQNNGSRITANVLRNISTLFSVRNALTSSQKDNASKRGLFGLVDEYAKLKDADRQEDIYSVPSFDSFDDILQDYISYMVLSADSLIPSFQSTIKDIHYFGANINRIESLRTNYHKTYDYIKTSGCNLYFICNKKEREDLESAYDKGITRWHIDNDNKTIGNNFKWFNKNLINLSNVMYNYY